jgi:DNA-binding NtrC family response regulator
MTRKPIVLLVEDSTPLATLYQQYLKDEKIKLVCVDSGEKAKDFITQNIPNLVLLDLNLPDIQGGEILQWIRDQEFPTAVIVVTANDSIDVAVEMMRVGANDFLDKPIDANRLKITVFNILETSSLKHIVEDYQQTFDRERYHGFIGTSLAIQAVYRIIDSVSPSKASVFITGESGTGKEVCAEAIHNQGSRSQQAFIALNCGAIPHELMESEMFGHVKGAFTGAFSDRKGAASLADGGTLFLDEIGEMDLDLQTKLLRFIQTGKFQKVGSSKEESVDIRFLCATNRDPQEAVLAGTFREDLYYRLHVVPIHLPPLNERGDDILAIANEFLLSYASEENKSFQSFSPEVEAILMQYAWPGNVRQLQNVIRNIVVLHEDKQVMRNHLPAPLDSVLNKFTSTPLDNATLKVSNNSLNNSAVIRPLAQVEREVIEHAIALCGDNIPKAAALLEVSPSTIYRKKQTWEQDLYP